MSWTDQVRAVQGELLAEERRGDLSSRKKRELRTMVDGLQQLAAIVRSIEVLEAGVEQVLSASTGLMEEVPLSSTRTAQLAAAIAARQRLLNKVLPDLKAVELTGQDGGPLTVHNQSDALTLETKLRRFMVERGVLGPLGSAEEWLS